MKTREIISELGKIYTYKKRITDNIYNDKGKLIAKAKYIYPISFAKISKLSLISIETLRRWHQGSQVPSARLSIKLKKNLKKNYRFSLHHRITKYNTESKVFSFCGIRIKSSRIHFKPLIGGKYEPSTNKNDKEFRYIWWKKSDGYLEYSAVWRGDADYKGKKLTKDEAIILADKYLNAIVINDGINGGENRQYDTWLHKYILYRGSGNLRLKTSGENASGKGEKIKTNKNRK